MPAQRAGYPGLVPVTYQTVALTNSTAVSLTSTAITAVGKASVMDICCTSDDVRLRFDSTAVTAATGIVLQKDTLYRWEGLDGTSTTLSNISFVADGGGAASVFAQFWRYARDSA